jgi:hypothetical protein
LAAGFFLAGAFLAAAFFAVGFLFVVMEQTLVHKSSPR